MRAPKLGFGYFGQTLNKESYFQGFTVGLQLPLFSGANTARAKASEISMSQSQLEFDKTKLTLKLQKKELVNQFAKQEKETLKKYPFLFFSYVDNIVFVGIWYRQTFSPTLGSHLLLLIFARFFILSIAFITIVCVQILTFFYPIKICLFLVSETEWFL